MSIYSDINTYKEENFPLVTDIDSVVQSVYNFFATMKGQRFFRPTLGCNLIKELLFELNEEDAVLYALNSITEQLEIWDPRVEIMDETTVEVFQDDKKVNIDLVFRVKGFEDTIITKNFTI